MLLASLEVWHSRPIAPTRRVALGDSVLPVDPAPGPGGLLLGAVLARFASRLDVELQAEMIYLLDDIERGKEIGQPRLRYRRQRDRVGLLRSRHRLVRESDGLRFSFDSSKSLPAQSALAAAYACELIPDEHRGEVMAVMRRGLDWHGSVGPGLIDHLVGPDVAARFRSGDLGVASDPMLWALGILGLEATGSPDPRDVQKSYRKLVRTAHPDHGGGQHVAADRIAELSRAREILLP